MVEGILTCQQLASRSMDIFSPIYYEWRRQEHRDPSLVNELGDMDTAQVLEQDFRAIGIYLISRDDRATRIELAALVDCIAELRSRGVANSAAINIEQLTQEFELQKHKNAGSSFTPPPVSVSLPLCLRVARDLKHMGKTADAKGLKEMLVEFLHRIVLQDGNVMAHEIAAVKDIEEFLADMTDTAA